MLVQELVDDFSRTMKYQMRYSFSKIGSRWMLYKSCVWRMLATIIIYNIIQSCCKQY